MPSGAAFNRAQKGLSLILAYMMAVQPMLQAGPYASGTGHRGGVVPPAGFMDVLAKGPAAFGAAQRARSESTTAATISVVSAASYYSLVAPGSLATIFGSTLAASTASAVLDSQGQLPLQLGGAAVQIGGASAPLLYASPGQINFFVPTTANTGSLAVTVTSGGQSQTGTANVSLTAPGLFMVDANQTGAVLNAVTYGLGPFTVTTAVNPTADKATRLAIFGTGLRFAGNSSRAPGVNATGSVSATATLNDGSVVPLTVEFAGAAPGFFGLDQINVVLPASMDGAGLVKLVVNAGAQASNYVVVTIVPSKPPVVSTFSPAGAPPGAEVNISGSGFPNIPLNGTGGATSVLFRIGGTDYPGLLLQATTQTITAVVPPITLPGTTNWYAGPALICAVVAGSEVCSSQSFNIQPRMNSTLPPGQMLTNLVNQAGQIGTAAMQAAGLSNVVSQSAAPTQALASELNSLVQNAVAGKPQMRTITIGADSVTVAFDLNTLEQMESLLAGNASAPGSVTAQLAEMSNTAHRRLSTASTCPLSQEQSRLDAKSEDDKLVQAGAVMFAITAVAALASGVSVCVASGGIGCALALALPVLAVEVVMAYAGVEHFRRASQLALLQQ